jgi:hypothetical protein
MKMNKPKNKVTSMRMNEGVLDAINKDGITVSDVINTFSELCEIIGPKSALKLMRDKIVMERFKALGSESNNDTF